MKEKLLQEIKQAALELKKLSNNKLNVTIGSALDLFGGLLEFKKVLEYCK